MKQFARAQTLAAAVVLISIPGFAHPNHPPRPARAASDSDSLFTPPLLQNISSAPHTVEVNIVAAPTRLSLIPGKTTDVFAYNGQIPGPTLEVHEGDKVIIHFVNKLAEPTTIHWHGVHLPANQDGSPFNPVPAGKSHDYIFTVFPGTAGTYWYHPHLDQRTGYQIEKGLYGAFIVRPAVDPLQGIPEKLLILSDNRFRADGSLDFPERTSPQGEIDEINGREGNVLFVNGRVLPTIRIRSGEVQRWRVINTSAARVYKLGIPGQTMLHVGSDGGLFERPVEVKDVTVANSERVEVLVRGTGSRGSTASLQMLPYDRYVPQTRPADWNQPRDLITLQYSNDDPLPSVTVPATLRRIPVLDTTKVAATRDISLSQGLINGRMMDMNRVDVTASLGTTEIWQIENLVGMDHPFHLHGFQFQIIERNGVPEPFRSWKDVVNVPKHQTVRFVVRYDDFPGKWMFHCHILDHEDHGMMGILEVKPRKKGS
jgi:bilirubin oxidase